MNRYSLLGGFAMAVVWIAVVAAETPNEQPNAEKIPLDQIWAYDIPGTRDVRELEPKADLELLGDDLKGLSPDDAVRRMAEEFTRRLDVWKIVKVLKHRPKEGEKAGPGFVVTGIGKEALQNAGRIFSNGKNATNVVRSDTDLSLVFYSYMCGRFVEIISVERSAELISLKYRFVAQQKGVMSTRFALIPLGRLPEKTYQVEIEQLEPIDEKGRPVAPMRDPQRLVSDSFSFVVQRK